MSDFMAEFKARVIALIVPDDATPADRVAVDVRVDATTQYAGEMDESTDAEITASATGYDEYGKRLWSYSREYGEMTGYDSKDPSAPYGLMRLIADLAEVDPEQAAPVDSADSTRPPAYKTEESTDVHEIRGGFPG